MKEQNLQSYYQLRHGGVPITLPTGQAGIGMKAETKEGEFAQFTVILPV